MSLWIYDFKQLLNAKNLLITHKSNLEQFFNFLTYVCLGLSYYLKKLNNKGWSKFLIISVAAIVVLGFFFTYNSQKTEMIDGIEVPILDKNYKFDLTI